MRDRRVRLGLTGALLFFVLRAFDASAIAFGDTANGASMFLTPCAPTTITALPLVVDVPSRIFVNGTAPFYGNGNGAYNNASYQIVLRDAADTATLASIPSTVLYTSDSGYVTHAMNGVGVLYDGSTPYAAPAGSYLLKFVVSAGGSCSGGGPIVWSSSLSYILLSSALDRIFANGFNAMVFDSHRPPQQEMA